MMCISRSDSIKQGIALGCINFRCLVLVIVHPERCLHMLALNMRTGLCCHIMQRQSCQISLWKWIVLCWWDKLRLFLWVHFANTPVWFCNWYESIHSSKQTPAYEMPSIMWSSKGFCRLFLYCEVESHDGENVVPQ